MRRVCDSGREGVRDGHGAGHDAFNGRREATSWQAHNSWGIPRGQRETKVKQQFEICETPGHIRSAML